MKSMVNKTRAAALLYGIASAVFGLPLAGYGQDPSSSEARLRQSIKNSVKPKTAERNPLPSEIERLLIWSEPVNGLAARIEDLGDGGTTRVVRLKNVSERPIAVPTGNPRNKNAPQFFEVQMRQGAGPWQRAKRTWDEYREEPDAGDELAFRARQIQGVEVDRPHVTLRPKEHCLAYACAYFPQDDGQPKEFKVVLRQARLDTGQEWHGVLETPTQRATHSPWPPTALLGRLPMPEHFPAFSYAFRGINWSGEEPAVEALWDANRELFDLLLIYDPGAVQKEFERRMRTEKRLPMKLLLAVVAARAGSEEAALFILETMRETDYRTRINVHGALRRLFPYSSLKAEPRAWVVELSIAVLSDERLATGVEKAKWAAGTSFMVNSCGTAVLEFELGEARCRQAVPLFVKWIKQGRAGWYTIMALGAIGDARAIPPLMELVETRGKKAVYSRVNGGLDRDLATPAYALSKLKAREAVPLLLHYVEFPEIITDVGEIGDPREIAPLKELIAAGGEIVRDGKAVYPELAAERLFAAKVALAQVDRDNGVASLGEMLGDQVLSVDQRKEVLLVIGRRHDPRSVPYLIKAIKTESRYQPRSSTNSRYYLIHMAISDLGEFKSKAAVEGLIDCFDLDFKTENLWKGGEATPASYRNHIARSLQRITGQTIGANKEQWQKWWRDRGRHRADLANP